MLEYPLSKENIIKCGKDAHPYYTLSENTIAYIQAFLTPVYSELEKYHNVNEIHESISKWAQIKENEYSELSKHGCSEAMKAYNNSEKETNNEPINLQQMIYGAIEYLIMEILQLAGNQLHDNNELLSDKDELSDNLDIYIITDEYVFTAIFNDDELRWMFFAIMPSPFKLVDHDFIFNYIHQSLKYEVEKPNDLCVEVIYKFIWYLQKIYDHHYRDVSNSIKDQYPQLKNENTIDPIIFTLTENIKNRDWDLNNPKFFIISMYDNNIIDWKTPLSHQITN